MRERNKGTKNSRRGTKNTGSAMWRGRGWSPVRPKHSGNCNFRACMGWGGCDDPIGYKNLNRQWIKEDQRDQVNEIMSQKVGKFESVG